MMNASIGNATGLALFEINYRYMPTMMKKMRVTEKTPQGVKMFTQNALKNMTCYSNKGQDIPTEIH